mmetsp:Transcript_44639/g.142134  ORF Transcript_44639/g.142134 Transcript_44639/m.142134 type:complete len:206 (-) Transcript_44639:536-1153(-)
MDLRGLVAVFTHLGLQVQEVALEVPHLLLVLSAPAALAAAALAARGLEELLPERLLERGRDRLAHHALDFRAEPPRQPGLGGGRGGALCGGTPALAPAALAPALFLQPEEVFDVLEVCGQGPHPLLHKTHSALRRPIPGRPLAPAAHALEGVAEGVVHGLQHLDALHTTVELLLARSLLCHLLHRAGQPSRLGHHLLLGHGHPLL